jgi:hypothetical protein
MSQIYVLKLTHNKWYVGKSDIIDQRLLQHSTGAGSEWTKRYVPISIANIYPSTSPYDEDKYTKELMGQYGIDNVRGGSYCQVELDGLTRHFLQREIRGATDKCFRCGSSEHFVSHCPKASMHCKRCGRDSHVKENCRAISDVNGQLIPTCTRCGRDGHYQHQCYARRDLHGKYLGLIKRKCGDQPIGMTGSNPNDNVNDFRVDSPPLDD